MRGALIVLALVVWGSANAGPSQDFEKAKEYFRKKDCGSARPVLKDVLYPERIASLVALPMGVMTIIAKPFVLVLAASTKLLLKLLRADNAGSDRVTEEEIRLLVAEGHEQGIIDASRVLSGFPHASGANGHRHSQWADNVDRLRMQTARWFH